MVQCNTVWKETVQITFTARHLRKTIKQVRQQDTSPPYGAALPGGATAP